MDVAVLIAAIRFPRAQVHPRPGPSLGDGTLTVETLDFPAKAATVDAFLAEHYQAWQDGLAHLAQESWERPLGPSWGPFSEASTLDLALRVLDEVIHHGAEVGLLGDAWSAGQDESSGPTEISSWRRGWSSRNRIRGRGTLASASMEP